MERIDLKFENNPDKMSETELRTALKNCRAGWEGFQKWVYETFGNSKLLNIRQAVASHRITPIAGAINLGEQEGILALKNLVSVQTSSLEECYASNLALKNENRELKKKLGLS